MFLVRRSLFRFLLGVALVIPLRGEPGVAAPARLRAGDTLPEVVTERETYRDVTLLSVNHETVMFRHPAGLASVRLDALPTELVARLEVPPAPKPRPTAGASISAPHAAATAASSAPRPRRVVGRLDSVFERFGTPPSFMASTNFQSEYIALGLGAKDQGRRPSCAIFAVVAALELEYTRLAGSPVRFSEDYVIWATRESLGQNAAARQAFVDTGGWPREDLGYTLPEVVGAVRSFGVPRQEDMPNKPATRMSQIKPPDLALTTRARERLRASLHEIPGRDPRLRLNNVVHVLNAGLPVPVGMLWPPNNEIIDGVIDQQSPMRYGHAVLLVGYECPNGRLEDTTFVFKNSYGTSWGRDGFGRVSARYLSRWMMDAVLLEVRVGP